MNKSIYLDQISEGHLPVSNEKIFNGKKELILLPDLRSKIKLLYKYCIYNIYYKFLS